MGSGTLEGKSDVLIAYQPAREMAGIVLEDNCHRFTPTGRAAGRTGPTQAQAASVRSVS